MSYNVLLVVYIVKGKGKSKSVSLHALAGPKGSSSLKRLELLDNRHAPAAFTLQGTPLLLISARG